MRYVATLLLASSFLVSACDNGSTPIAAPTTAASPANRDVHFFRDNASRQLAHFRVRWRGKTVGQTIDPKGYIHEVKKYFASEPRVAEFYLEAGPERLAITEFAPNRRLAVYFKNLQILPTHAQADVYGLACNFGYHGPGGRVSLHQQTSRNGNPEAPQPQRFEPGKPIEGRAGGVGMLRNGNPADGYTVHSDIDFSIELVEITTLEPIMKDNPALDNDFPKQADDDVKRDLEPASQPATRPGKE